MNRRVSFEWPSEFFDRGEPWFGLNYWAACLWGRSYRNEIGFVVMHSGFRLLGVRLDKWKKSDSIPLKGEQIQRMAVLLRRAKQYIEGAEVVIERETGKGRNLDELIRAGEMPEIYGDLLLELETKE